MLSLESDSWKREGRERGREGEREGDRQKDTDKQTWMRLVQQTRDET